MNPISRSIDQFNSFIGKSVAWFTTILVLLICTDVFMRYIFNFTKTWVIELEWHLFGLIFLLGAAYTFKKNRHVRVDLFYSKFSRKTKNIIDLLGTLLFLIPWCLIVIFTAWDYAMNSFSFKEGSPNPGGLPARYLIKSVISIGFILLLLQGVSLILKILFTGLNYDFAEEES